MQNLQIEKVLKFTNKPDVDLTLNPVQDQSVAMDQSVMMNRSASNHSITQMIESALLAIPNQIGEHGLKRNWIAYIAARNTLRKDL